METDRVEQAATCDHQWVGYVRGGEPLSVRICQACGWPDWADLREQVEQLRYERRLLGMARRVLDLLADGENQGYDPDYIRNQAADVAQRIVDEIGHPATDEPALGPSLRDQLAEAQRREELVRPVLEAVTAWRDRYLYALGRPGAGVSVTAQSRDLVAVLDTYETQAGGRVPADPAAATVGDQVDGDQWLVWSHHQAAWWGPSGHGYRRDVRDAGRLTNADAIKACGMRTWSDDHRPPEVMIRCPTDQQLGRPTAARLLARLIDQATKEAVAARLASRQQGSAS